MVKSRRVRSRFLYVQCNKCRNKQVVFGCAKTKVGCLACNTPLLIPTGGKSALVKNPITKLPNAHILEILDKNL
ncbi:MAG: hypothetical protein BWK75_05540 [Candidatus Altiarchaeales archaeon A3]|nr:MAG: hypothetical protein BWK75_05540 [Candidatus Altiarchaeales archaeon A3]